MLSGGRNLCDLFGSNVKFVSAFLDDGVEGRGKSKKGKETEYFLSHCVMMPHCG